MRSDLEMTQIMHRVITVSMFLILFQVLLINTEICSAGMESGSGVVNESQQKDNEDIFEKDLPSIKGMASSFGIVIALIIIFFVFLKWRYGFSGGVKGNRKYIQVVESRSLGPKRYLYLVKVVDKLLVIGSTNDGLSLLSEMNDDGKVVQVEKPSSGADGFSGFLKKVYSNKNS